MLQQIHTDTEKREPDEEDRRIRKASENGLNLRSFWVWEIKKFFDLILILNDLCF